jgi:hypothetical protein
MGGEEQEGGTGDELVLYMLHCGLDGKLLEDICRKHGLRVRIHQFPREELFAYQMHPKRKAPDLILIRGHFISLVHDLDRERHIPYAVVSSKLKYGTGQPVFVHAAGGYGDEGGRLGLYHSIAETIVRMVADKERRSSESHPSTEVKDPAEGVGSEPQS